MIIKKCPFKSESLFQNNEQKNINSEERKEILKIFKIENENELPYEITYLLDNPNFHYDFEHQNDNNSNYQYVNEKFLDII